MGSDLCNLDVDEDLNLPFPDSDSCLEGSDSASAGGYRLPRRF